MTTLTEKTLDVIGYLLGQAASNPALGAAPVPVIVIDGQPATADVLTVNETGLTQWLWIGSHGYGTPGEQAEAASADQDFSFLDQAQTRDDRIQVLCAAEAVAGSGVMAEARSGAYAVMAAIEVLLRGSPPSGPGDASMGGLVFWSGVTGPVSLSQAQTAQGARALIQFQVSAFVRLTS